MACLLRIKRIKTAAGFDKSSAFVLPHQGFFEDSPNSPFSPTADNNIPSHPATLYNFFNGSFLIPKIGGGLPKAGPSRLCPGLSVQTSVQGVLTQKKSCSSRPQPSMPSLPRSVTEHEHQISRFNQRSQSRSKRAQQKSCHAPRPSLPCMNLNFFKVI